ncbi:MAG: REP-associated tyrosine transposase [Pseudomarimonas sp.]
MKEPAFRRRPVHWFPDSNHESPLVFITCCTKNRRPCLARDTIHAALRLAWQAANAWQVGRYVVMPDHIHLFCAPKSCDTSLGKWMAFWRSLTTRSLSDESGNLWQREYWDRQLRRQDSYAEKWEYVRNNPVRAGLVSKSEDWPFQGEMNRLDWIGDR